MNRLNRLFREKGENILSIYFTAGYPGRGDTVEIIRALSEHGADIIEIGIPFSDPVADGPTIQESNKKALDNGMTLKILFDELGGVREVTDIPLVLMGYLNPVIRMGVEEFCRQCAEVKIDGLIIPDMPVWEYEIQYRPIFQKYGLSNVFFITPQTSEERIRAMDEATDTFLYMVSSPSITGARQGIEDQQIKYFERIQGMNLRNPTLIGFGISDHETFRTACRYSSGAIIGSAFINELGKGGDISEVISLFMNRILTGS